MPNQSYVCFVNGNTLNLSPLSRKLTPPPMAII